MCIFSVPYRIVYFIIVNIYAYIYIFVFSHLRRLRTSPYVNSVLVCTVRFIFLFVCVRVCYLILVLLCLDVVLELFFRSCRSRVTWVVGHRI